MGVGGMAATIASCFGFVELTSIEVSDTSPYSACDILPNSFYRSRNIILRVGRVQDYFVSDANIIYLDCNILDDSLDEGIFLRSFFSCWGAVIPGTFLILLTKSSLYNFKNLWNLELLYHKRTDYYNNMWILRTLNK
jgi:hypothetical protein